jgi:hypothetical protein
MAQNQTNNTQHKFDPMKTVLTGAVVVAGGVAVAALTKKENRKNLRKMAITVQHKGEQLAEKAQEWSNEYLEANKDAVKTARKVKKLAKKTPRR